MLKKELENKILRWLNDTGYPLELYCAQQFSKAGFFCTSSSLYKDLETEQSREIDLQVSKYWNNGNLSLGITIMIECKKTNKPLLLLTNNNERYREIDLFGGLTTQVPIVYPLINFLTSGSGSSIPIVPLDSPIGFKIIPAFTETDNHIFSGISGLTKSYNYLFKQDEELRDQYVENNVNTLNIPALVVESKLFSVYLDENKETSVKNIESGVLEFHIPWKIETGEYVYIPVITKEFLPKFIENIVSFGLHFFNYIVENPNTSLKAYNELQVKTKQTS